MSNSDVNQLSVRFGGKPPVSQELVQAVFLYYQGKVSAVKILQKLESLDWAQVTWVSNHHAIAQLLANIKLDRLLDLLKEGLSNETQDC